ncbi:MAG: ABC transporter ATP-binding protein [Armatimonadota bacterium]|nr:ABC transporter ATP-binding protein [Armatimonadota bacterium]MDR7451840.1 ABC transporter ATP-binding protein [Armatimonadota bacterium]MDR7467565.1 ABC transporter ATP-binding protein [Armatimonadota bacterium]MDR7494474.1 ABC transporter ATP-binding protein [Armatimonadota bacterium]MDR7499735.1 ABC transporter ATP-binding protein [Armatimonadota bacterium]
MTAAPGIIEARDVFKVFVARTERRRRHAFLALHDVSLTIPQGRFVSFVGPSGCGKSTLLNMIAGLIRPTDGEVRYKGRAVEGVNTDVGYITQDDNLLPWRTLLENVEVALEFRGVAAGARRERARRYIQRVGLSGFEHHYPHELSGGMRKRTALIRTLVYEPDVILMDEPFGPLDAQTRVLLQDELLRLWEGSGKTIVFVTHDLVEAIALSDEIVLFSRAPGTIKRVYPVPLPRPRDVFRIHADPLFPAFYERLWHDLKEEITMVDQEAAAHGPA